MAAAYVVPRPKGGGKPTSYAVEDHADHELYTCRTQDEGIQWARKHGYSPIHVPRVEHAEKGNPDQWREV